MKTKIVILVISAIFMLNLKAISRTTRFSIYDPLGVLLPPQRLKLETEGTLIISNRTINGSPLLIQIDFLSPNEFSEGGITGRNRDGTSIFSQGTYLKWSMDNVHQPAVLILFIDNGSKYELKSLDFSDPLMDQGIPDLIRRYIRDEIMMKETDYYEIISSGLYAISEALNPIYKQRLETKGLEMLSTDDRYKRGHCVYGNCQYYEFTPGEEGMIGPVIPKEEIVLKNLPENQSERLKSTVNKIKGWNYTHESRIVSNWPWIYINGVWGLESLIPEDFFLIKRDNPWSILNSNEITLDIADELPTMGWLQIHGWKATFCNFFAQDLSSYVIGNLPWRNNKVANEIQEYILHSNDFIEITGLGNSGIYSEMGLIVYFTKKGNERNDGSLRPGHIATGWVMNDKVIQAGPTTGLLSPAEGFGNLEGVLIHIYVGHLKKEAL